MPGAYFIGQGAKFRSEPRWWPEDPHDYRSTGAGDGSTEPSAQHSCRTAEGLEVDLESLSLKRNHSYSERTAPTSCAITSGTTVVASIFSGIPRPRHFASSAYSSAGVQEPWDRAVGAAAASAGCYSWTTARQYDTKLISSVKNKSDSSVVVM